MEKQLEEAVQKLAGKAVETKSSLEAMQYTQAALNAANALMTLKLKEKS
jgi:hypothetical protein